MRDINKIVLHCSATREGHDVSTETIRGWHVNKRGWSDIGYHFVVLLDGTVDKARPIERQGAHVRGHNKGSIGIAYIGGVEEKRNGFVEALPEVLRLLHDDRDFFRAAPGDSGSGSRLRLRVALSRSGVRRDECEVHFCSEGSGGCTL